MTLHWADLALMLAMVAAGWGASYFLLLRKLRQAALDRQREIERRVSTLTEVIRSLEARLTESGFTEDSYAPQVTESESIAGGIGMPVEQDEESIAPEIQVAIAAAAVAFLGRNARVRSARLVPSPWSQQGRVLVHASHNLRSRR